MSLHINYCYVFGGREIHPAFFGRGKKICS